MASASAEPKQVKRPSKWKKMTSAEQLVLCMKLKAKENIERQPNTKMPATELASGSTNSAMQVQHP